MIKKKYKFPNQNFLKKMSEHFSTHFPEDFIKMDIGIS